MSNRSGQGMVRGKAGLSGMILAVLAIASPVRATASEIVLTVKHGPGPLDVTLQWTGGQPSYEVLRSANASAVCNAESLLGLTDAQTWIDLAPPAAVFYKVRSAFAAEPAEVCNGVDDDCNGIIDDNTTDCDAGACQTCLSGACRSRCGTCDDCIGGTCQTRCGSCQTCVNGTCGPCNPAQCQVCAGGVCQSTCDFSQCLACGSNGTCATFCSICETCLNGTCLDACDRGQCLSCQSGSCKPFCDPVCQTCTPQGCSDTCGPCQRCTNGVCHSRCDPNACEDCVDGQCRSRCAPDEICVFGVCSPGSS